MTHNYGFVSQFDSSMWVFWGQELGLIK